MMSTTLSEVRNNKDLRPTLRGMIRNAISSYNDFTQVIHSEIIHAIRAMVRNCQMFQELSEDQITFWIISRFETLGFHVAHDKQIGGHVDISVEYDDYLWLAEAKIHSSYLTLQRGWEQLSTRYSTGMSGEDDGAFLIYNFNKNALNVTNEWKNFLAEFYPEVEIGPIEEDLNFRTAHSHERTGRPYTVKHYNIPLHHNPKDREL